MRLFLLALVGASLAAAQATDSAKNARLEGQVVSTAGGPVKGATIQLVGRPGQEPRPSNNIQSSDNDGKFVFAAVPPGTYIVGVQKEGFVPGTASQLTLAPGQVLKDLIVKLNSMGVITGRVIDQDGDPVPNAQVRALHYVNLGGVNQMMNGGLRSGSGGLFRSDEKGNFRLFSLEPDHYYVSAIPARSTVVPLGADPAGRESDVTTYYPSSLAPASATPLDLSGGVELSGIDIRIRKAQVYSIRGKAVDTKNAGAVVNTMIGLSSKEDLSVNMSILSRDGTFQLPYMIPGTYVLKARPFPQPPGAQANGTPIRNFIGSVEVTINDSDVDGIVLQLTPADPFDIVGSIKVEDGDLKQITSGLPGLSMVALRDVETTNPMLRPEIKDDGTFRLQGLKPGRYMVDFSLLQIAPIILAPTAGPGVYVKSVRFAGQDVTALLDLTSAKEGSLQIVLSGKAAVVTGTVRNAQGNVVPSTRFALWPKIPDPFSLLGGVRGAKTDVDGRVRISGLAPGDYYLAAWEDVDSGLFENPDFLKLSARDASSVKLGEGASETVEVKLISKEKSAAMVAALP